LKAKSRSAWRAWSWTAGLQIRMLLEGSGK
jgi:hypothetical protein